LTVTSQWTTDGIKPAAALGAWEQKMSELHLTWALSPLTDEPFSAGVRYRSSGDILIADFEGDPFAGARLADTNADVIGITINVSGRIRCRSGGKEMLVEPHQVFVWNSLRPQGFVSYDRRHEITLIMPAARAPRAIAQVADCDAGAAGTAAGSGLFSVAAGQLRIICSELEFLDDAALAIACQAFLDTLDAAVLVPRDSSGRESVRASQLRTIKRYIEDRLDDSQLSTLSVARANDMSVRSLHLIFSESGVSVGRWIRERRLRRCYSELAHAPRDVSVTDIAFRWGFNDAAHFSRVFKAAFGQTPSSVLGANARSTAPALTG
jgi:AraC-like DNA-binding protein